MSRKGKKYQPSNGTEGMWFTEAYCDQCIHCHPHPDKQPQCKILLATMVFDVKDEKYPDEWIWNDDDQPECTAFQKWDWGNDHDGWNEPPEPPYEPQDPGQLTIFTIDELIETPVCQVNEK